MCKTYFLIHIYIGVINNKTVFIFNQIKSNHLFIGPQVNNIHINKNDYTITNIYFVAGELQDSSGCFHTSSHGSEK